MPASDPTNTTYQNYLAMAYSDVTELLDREGKYDEAAANSRKSGEIFAQLLSQNPADVLARVNALHVPTMLLNYWDRGPGGRARHGEPAECCRGRPFRLRTT